MNIALDFDETITLDPLFWGAFIKLARASKHHVEIVTSRSASVHKENQDIEEFANEWDVGIVYCNGFQKAAHAQADVWIDDYPASIPTYSQFHTGERL